MHALAGLLLLPLVLPAGPGTPPDEIRFDLSLPPVVLRGSTLAELRVEAQDPDGEVRLDFSGNVQLEGLVYAGDAPDGPELRVATVVFEEGVLLLRGVRFTSPELVITSGGERWEIPVRQIPGWLSLLPPLLAIGLAIATREVLLSLFAGIWLGATIITGYNPVVGFLASLDTFLVGSLGNPENASIVLFTLTLSGMVGLMAKAGGTKGLAEVFARYARTVRSGQISAFTLGLVIFFDDYANSLLVGNTLRPLTDRLRISREKLAYIVDSTAAPVAGLALISTWVGFEVGVIQSALDAIGQGDRSAFTVFIDSIPYRFYSVLAIVFVVFVAWSGRDFGPMHRAERRARLEGKVLADDATPLLDRAVTDLEAGADVAPRWSLAALPVLTVILATGAGLAYTGWPSLAELEPDAGALARIRAVIEGSDAFKVLFWGAAAGSLVAGAGAMATRTLDLKETIAGWMTGVRAMIIAIAILVLAWSIKGVCDSLQTGQYVVDLTRGWLTPGLLPTVIFVAAAGISFSTGTSYGTMGILMPIAVPLAAGLAPGDDRVLIGSIGSVLAGAIFGDHCSPISDTTVLSSVASASDHIDHVRTQIPYALAVGAASILLGTLPVGYGMPAWLGLLLGAVGLAVLLRFVGKPVESG